MTEHPTDSDGDERATDGIAVLAADGSVTFANDAYASFFGHDEASSVVGSHWGSLHADVERFEIDCRSAVEATGEWRGEVTASRPDGSEIPVQVSMTGLDSGEFVCVARSIVTERRTEEMLTGLAEAGRELLRSADDDSVAWIAVETIESVLGFDLGCVRRYDSDANELVRSAVTEQAARLLQSAVAYDLSASNAGAAYRSGAIVRSETPVDDAYASDPCHAELHVPLGEFGVLSVFDREEALDDRDVRLVELFAELVQSAFTRAEREEQLRSQRLELERRRDELVASDRFNDLVTEVIRSVLRATSGRSVKESVCEGLADSSLYDAAWIATVDEETDEVDVAVRSVATDPFVEREGAAFVNSPFVHQLVRKTDRDDGSVVERRRFESRELGDEESIAAAVPVACGRQRFGVLGVAGTEESGFGETTRSGLELLGETLAFALIAERRREMLTRRDVVELEFAFESPMGELSAAFDCRCDHLGRTEDDGDNGYEIRITHGAFDEIREFLAAYPSVQACELVTATETECVISVEVDRAPPQLLAEAGFSLESLYAEDGETRLVAEVPEDEDVVRVLESLRDHWEDVRLVAKRQTPTRRPPVPLATETASKLTDRQRSVLASAHEMGYYDWPRGHTAEEVADELDIASATLHQHLRAAEQALVSAFVAEIE